MKDLSKYIESLLDGIKKPCEVKYVGNVYYVDVVYDYDNNATFYRFGDFIIESLVKKIESILKTYIPDTTFKVRVNRINIPIEYLTINVTINESSLMEWDDGMYVVDHYTMNFLDNMDPL